MYFPEMCCKYFALRTRKISRDGYKMCCWKNVSFPLLVWGTFMLWVFLFYAKQPKGPQLLPIYQLDRLALGRVHCYDDFSLFFFPSLFKNKYIFLTLHSIPFLRPPSSLFLHAEASLQLCYQWKTWLLKCSSSAVDVSPCRLCHNS